MRSKDNNFGCKTSLSRVSSRDFWEKFLFLKKKKMSRVVVDILEADDNFDIDRKKWCKDR